MSKILQMPSLFILALVECVKSIPLLQLSGRFRNALSHRCKHLRSFSLLFLFGLCLQGCAPEVQGFHSARMNGLVSKANLSEGQSKRALDHIKEQNADLETRVQALRALVTRAENKAELCEQKAEALSVRGGSYSKIR